MSVGTINWNTHLDSAYMLVSLIWTGWAQAMTYNVKYITQGGPIGSLWPHRAPPIQPTNSLGSAVHYVTFYKICDSVLCFYCRWKLRGNGSIPELIRRTLGSTPMQMFHRDFDTFLLEIFQHFFIRQTLYTFSKSIMNLKKRKTTRCWHCFCFMSNDATLHLLCSS